VVRLLVQRLGAVQHPERPEVRALLHTACAPVLTPAQHYPAPVVVVQPDPGRDREHARVQRRRLEPVRPADRHRVRGHRDHRVLERAVAAPVRPAVRVSMLDDRAAADGHARLTYLAKCPGSTCTGVNAASLQWFKIDQAGLLSGTIASGSWGAGKMIAQNNSWTSTIPSSVPSGSYLIRFETIALHSLPAQMYPECAQINIVNGGSRAPTSSELCSFPGCYSNSDPGRTSPPTCSAHTH
jgi:hypothetical protein